VSDRAFAAAMGMVLLTLVIAALLLQARLRPRR